MNNEDMQRVVKIMFAADGGCMYCVSDLSILFIDEFPEYEEFVRKKFIDEFECKIEEVRE